MKLDEYLAKSDKSIESHNQDLILCLDTMQKYGYIKTHQLYELAKIACELHDCGKVNPEFQKRVKSDKKIKFDENKEVAHNILSLYFMNPQDYKEIDYVRLAFAVAYHHNYCDVQMTLDRKKDLIRQLLSDFKEDFIQPKKSLQYKIMDIFQEEESVLLKGYLHKCDYSASGNCKVEIPNDFLEQDMEQVLKTWRKRNKSASWNAMQEYCKANSGENIIVVAQTGMGKTEGALHWIGNHKGFFVLPLKTAINAMYQRIGQEIISGEKIEDKVAILHSESFEYLMQQSSKEIDVIEYHKKGKNLSMPLTVTTMDQLFDFVCIYPGYEMKLTTFSYSRIVIDEIQMYGPDLLAYLIRGIEMICEIGGKVAIVTATLPPFVRDLFEKSGFKYRSFVDDTRRHYVKLIHDKINSTDIVKQYIKNKEKDAPNKILVICNTIKTAQQLYKELLKSELKNDKEDLTKIHLFHTRYTKRDRIFLEKQIQDTGQTYNKDKKIEVKNEIWISTSLVEASLDIDFDYLFTELQDINSLFQRMGRCNRKGVKSIENFNCFVYLEIEQKLIRNGKSGFIDKTIYKLSKEALLDSEIGFYGLVTEQQKIQLLEKYFTLEKIEKSDFWREYKEEYKTIKNIRPYTTDKKDFDMRNIASVDVIPRKLYEQNKETYKQLMEEIKKEKDYIQKKALIERIKEDIVTIPQYEYLIACRNGQITRYQVLDIYGNGSIPVIECSYGVCGYERIDKEVEDTLATFW
ncbi:MAG: CRISPR-associated helicase Cas3' [Lachnospiraceae bacterium]